MASTTTYLQLCNRVLADLNQTLYLSDGSDFSGERSVLRNKVKDAINDALTDINTGEIKWPFAVVIDQSQTLTAGTETYAFQADHKIADFDAFYIDNDGTLSTSMVPLQHISYQEYLRRHRRDDINAGASGRGVPAYVCESPDRKFIVTPSPDKAYVLKYNYYKNLTLLTTFDSVTEVFDEFYRVIVEGALHYMYRHRENEQAASTAYGAFMTKLTDMERILVGSFREVVDTRTGTYSLGGL